MPLPMICRYGLLWWRTMFNPDFRVPVKMREPVETFERRREKIQCKRFEIVTGLLDDSNPVVQEVTVPTSKQWKIVSALCRWYRGVNQGQYLRFNIESTLPDGAGNVYFGDGLAMADDAVNGVYWGHWLLGGAVGSESALIGGVAYRSRHYPLPDVWFDPSSVLEWSFYNGHAGDAVIVWYSFIERDMVL